MSGRLRITAMHPVHRALKAKMAAFALHDMPIQYTGIIKEHLHTRQAAGLFDVAHMGQLTFEGSQAIDFVEHVTPGDVRILKENEMRLSMITNERGGVKDDCMIAKINDKKVACVVNAGTKDGDYAYFREKLHDSRWKDVEMIIQDWNSLMALQGPKAAMVLSRYVDGLEKFPFMNIMEAKIKGMPVTISRSGYTGEDGFEISVGQQHAVSLMELLLSNSEVAPVGLGARDTLRLEAGMCLYGHELNEDINPVAARLMWTITKRRLTEGGFVGHEAITKFKANPDTVPRVRVGFTSKGPVAREGTPIHVDGKVVGTLTSGSPSPSLGINIGMGYIDKAFQKKGTKVQLMVRGRPLDAEVTTVPFTPPHYFKL